MVSIRERIASGHVASGERLPSIRRLATQYGFSPSTIAEAYERLVAEGLLSARPGSGYFAQGKARMEVPATPRRACEIDPFWVSRQALEADPAVMQPGCGWLPPDWMPQDALRQALRVMSRSDATALSGYGPTKGSPELRVHLSRRWADEQFHISPDQILLTGSGTQAVDLVCRSLLRPGDTVLVDDPCYFNFMALLEVHKLKVIGVPCLADGPDLTVFDELLRKETPRLYITNSGLQNPVGSSLSPLKAHRLLGLAQACDLTIIEDDIFADLAPRPFASLAPLDGLERVVRVGSFSKTLSASLRCGYVAAQPSLIDTIADLQIATGFAGISPVTAGVVLHVLKGGSYRRHLEKLHRRLAKARKDVVGRLDALGIRPLVTPTGGFTLWCSMPQECDVTVLARLALEEGMLLAPGAVFSISGKADGLMRFNVAAMTDPLIMEHFIDLLRRVQSRHEPEVRAGDGGGNSA
ncbi:aminotransferase-like domain-containing protein [Asaia astilbis]|uniref:aminotransferase-like domain-containing protein n=1 Tax=Asaia astilbis TaxID=610244 RepID=UPI000A037C91|nr:PLP-dependent aminotransferase family protein [Asaia astilbis]